MSPRATLDQAEEDLKAARERVRETYYEWAGQLAREAAWDALALLEHEEGLEASRTGEIGQLEDRVRGLAGRDVLGSSLIQEAQVLDEVLDPALEPDYDPGLARREGGAEDYTTREDATRAIEAGQRIVDACRGVIEDA